jgi:hypothetical protein
MAALAQYILLASALMASLFLFLSLKREFHKQSVHLRAVIEVLGNLENTVGRGRSLASPGLTAPSFKDETRRQIIRQWRQGQSASQIAAVFAIPQAEVELLIRVERLVDSIGSVTVEPSLRTDQTRRLSPP